RRISWLIWQFIKWNVAFSVIALFNGFPILGKVTPVFYMATKGIGDWSLITRVFLLPIVPASKTELISLMPTMEVQYNLFYTLAVAVLTVFAVRMVLKLVRHFIQEPRNIWIRDLFLILSSVIIAIILGAPYWTMDITTPFDYAICLLLFVGFLSAAVYFHFIGLERDISFDRRKRIFFSGLALAIIASLGINAAIIAFYRLNWNNNWPQYEWQPLTEKQIAVTRWATGIQDIERRSIFELPTGNLTRTLSQVRQWDQQAAYTKMKNRIGVNWMDLADSDIIYVNGHEYWAAPTTISYPSTDWSSVHLFYTHSSKIIVIDSHTGEYVNVTDAFGLAREPLIYYGEGFDTPVYVNVKGFDEVENVNYSKEPDYVLSGWQRALWFTSQGQLGFASSPPQDSINMLYNRDVLKRVRDILIHGLKVDSDAYLVSDGSNVYYAVQVYIDYRLRSGFAAGSYMRYLAVVLVNVEDGTMQGYIVSKPDGFLVDFYTDYYQSWKPMEDPSAAWLRPQLRNPEELLGRPNKPGQLDVDFVFHVNEPFAWRAGTQFYERPPRTEVLYILVNDENKTYFAGLQLVEYLGSAGRNLAGMYLAFGGEDLGKVVFYEVPNATQFLGPTAAEIALKADEEAKTKLTFYGYYQTPATARLGNILLYPLGGKLYYFIPVYLVGEVMSTMPQVAIVDASSGTSVALGVDAADAYRRLVGGAVGGETPAEQRLAKVFQLFAGRELMNVTAVYPDVEVQVGNFTYVGESEWNATEAGINRFIQSYAPIGMKVFVWFEDENTVSMGVLTKVQDFVYLYYISVRYR
ncbi:MAG: hypothetical protein QXG97_06800, partial [Nitrososphaerota archaeon]